MYLDIPSPILREKLEQKSKLTIEQKALYGAGAFWFVTLFALLAFAFPKRDLDMLKVLPDDRNFYTAQDVSRYLLNLAKDRSFEWAEYGMPVKLRSWNIATNYYEDLTWVHTPYSKYKKAIPQEAELVYQQALGQYDEFYIAEIAGMLDPLLVGKKQEKFFVIAAWE